ncbi:hypothetical protein KI385_41695 [Streptomyces inhibens]|nr:hypothetical protein [Streptomyces inhibens]UKY54673.1 hypothetical protein KI385_41695 [Streptomyces inhibens]
MFAAYDLGKYRLYGHIKKTKNRSKFREFLPLPAFAAPIRRAHRERLRQLLPAPDHETVSPGGGPG